MDRDAYPSLPKLCVLTTRLRQQNHRVDAWVAERDANFERLRCAIAQSSREQALAAISGILGDPRHANRPTLRATAERLIEALQSKRTPATRISRLSAELLNECRYVLQKSHGRIAA
ncbi:MAG: hypothetical protein RH917_16085 [Lacipirellulaceae bacterium]